MNKAVQLLIAWDAFEQKHPNSNLDDFCRFYLSQNKQSHPAGVQSRGLLLKTLGRITSAFSLYHKAAMNKTNLPSPDLFYFLNGLAFLGEVRKTELINYLLMEYTTGMEAITRLQKEHLIQERADERDGRAKLISLSEKGKKTLADCYEYASKASEMVLGDLDEDSIQLCIHLLKGIEEKHSKLAVELKNKDFDDMYTQVCQADKE
ncbi:MarR family winged helix-turn-helix transcriptional regulator [Xanthocytophaga agilis]|uniref:MarR family winged helix-turn-helix transcriptional regulator n=1 Tax=Xanthocytophaga agilis TaxID=3048010 RepID=A0AAE3R966_9BACT|nr:MarR family winged helix-turn-helix transcriptional regulator [Xanthocytophaga agilis]MDJ1503769.1 MarR family winged helix-turn-helix transcriptional regulator [Xanthocytophaga agilis]